MFAWLWTFLILTAHAEYRVFELVITNADTGTEKIIYSTLDPVQYRGYYPVLSTETVQYRSTWKCKGNTAFKPLCPKPEPTPEAEAPGPSLDQK